MNLIPFGEVLRDRVEISKRYKLIEMVNGIWRLTKKCRDNYQSESYVKYLIGSLEKPVRIIKQEEFSNGPKDGIGPRGYTGPTGEKKLTPQQEMRTKEYQDAVSELFKL
jgi:hypothetical protein